VTRPWQQRQS